MSRKRVIRKKDLLEAIVGCNGFVSDVAKRLGVAWHTADNAIKLYPEAQELMRDEEEKTLDMVENKAIDAIKNNDGSMIRFYLATKGKRRGYTQDANSNNNTVSDNDLIVEIDDSPVEGLADEI